VLSKNKYWFGWAQHNVGDDLGLEDSADRQIKCDQGPFDLCVAGLPQIVENNSNEARRGALVR